MNLAIAPNSLPFRYKNKNYTINEIGIEDGIPYASVSPTNSDLEEELKKRIARDNGLKVYLGFNYKCFIEDYPQELI